MYLSPYKLINPAPFVKYHIWVKRFNIALTSASSYRLLKGMIAQMIAPASIKRKFTEVTTSHEVYLGVLFNQWRGQKKILTLKMFEIPREEVADLLRNLLLPLHFVFDGSFLRSPISTFSVLLSVVYLFSFGEVQNEFTNRIFCRRWWRMTSVFKSWYVCVILSIVRFYSLNPLFASTKISTMALRFS